MTDIQRRDEIFRLLPTERLLERDGARLASGGSGGRALDVLIALIERAGEVVGHRELMARVWPDVTVDAGETPGGRI